MSTTPGRRIAQAWIALRADDPEAASAFTVACERLEAAKSLRGLRRFRVFELRGALPAPEVMADLLHRSTQFYNPSKERCVVRCSSAEPSPVQAGEAVAVVVERGGDRRAAAERWWRHETGTRVEVREGVAWVMRFDPGADAAALGGALAVTRGRLSGLFANPHSQDVDVVTGPPSLEHWPGARRGPAGRGGRKGRP
ncbi:MAG: hypothetical protein IT347_00580 [Candidatus Eisenbacteria bacterium]|nr:hypothetical protein [Candidatus Eisenbacteria bacterium]